MTTITVGHLVTAVECNSWCPPGMVVDYAGATPPPGWLLCDGASYLRADYPDLFTAIGTAYGSADGTHFNVPDCRGRVTAGFAASGGHTDVSTLGNNDGVAAANRRPKHRHTVPNSSGGSFGNAAASGRDTNTGPDIPTGTATDSLDAPAWITLNRLIRAKDV
jgi:microcystin-dependent protein